jgi:hypothetical protein
VNKTVGPKIMFRVIAISLAFVASCNAAVYERFPGFKRLYEQADFVGIVTLVRRDVPKDQKAAWGDWIGPHRFFEITSVKVLKGPQIRSQIARLADRRLEIGDGSFFPVPLGEVLLPETRFLVFLSGSPIGASGRYRWDELHAEGAVLPVSPKTNLETLNLTKPLELFEQIVKDYTAHCKALYEHALDQERLLKANGQQVVTPNGP